MLCEKKLRKNSHILKDIKNNFYDSLIEKKYIIIQ